SGRAVRSLERSTSPGPALDAPAGYRVGSDSPPTAVQMAAISARQPDLRVPGRQRATGVADVTVRSSALKRIVKAWARRGFAAACRATSGRSSPAPSPGVRILTYHRVVDDVTDPFAVA